MNSAISFYNFAMIFGKTIRQIYNFIILHSFES